MSTSEKAQYFAQTVDSQTRDDLLLAASLIGSEKVAIDCGCGSGSDIAYLREQGFTVHAFDIEDESIRICCERFKDDEHVLLSQDSFMSFAYPESSLIVADASLFFCAESEFDMVWQKLQQSLCLGGIFCGSFLGPNDTMAGPDFDRDAYWSDILVFQEDELRSKFNQFDVIRFTEHEQAGETFTGEHHQWHIYSLVAKKLTSENG